jgi:hypothetical protein
VSQPAPALPVSKSGNGQETKPKDSGLPKLNIGECLRIAMGNNPN